MPLNPGGSFPRMWEDNGEEVMNPELHFQGKKQQEEEEELPDVGAAEPPDTDQEV